VRSLRGHTCRGLHRRYFGCFLKRQIATGLYPSRAVKAGSAKAWTSVSLDTKRAVPYQTAGLLAVLVHPHRADCALEVAEDVIDTGDYRLPRMIFGDLVRSSENQITKDKAQAFIRHRLPPHVIDKRTEWLNGRGTTLKMHFQLPDEALELFHKTIAADPTFAQPYYRIGYPVAKAQL
jgi:hypothetical protein